MLINQNAGTGRQDRRRWPAQCQGWGGRGLCTPAPGEGPIAAAMAASKAGEGGMTKGPAGLRLLWTRGVRQGQTSDSRVGGAT